MDLSLTEEQDALVQTAREFTRKEIIPMAGALRRDRRVPARDPEDAPGRPGS